MKKVIKLFVNIKKEQEWLAHQKGWKLIYTNGIIYTFEESACDYNYEYIFFEKSKKELDNIRNQIIDSDIEFVSSSLTWALFRKDAAKGEIHVYRDNYIKYKILVNKYNSYMALGSCFLCLGASQFALASRNGLSGLSSILFYYCSISFYIASFSLKKYSLEYDDGSYANRMKNKK